MTRIGRLLAEEFKVATDKWAEFNAPDNPDGTLGRYWAGKPKDMPPDLMSLYVQKRDANKAVMRDASFRNHIAAHNIPKPVVPDVQPIGRAMVAEHSMLSRILGRDAVNKEAINNLYSGEVETSDSDLNYIQRLNKIVHGKL
jgi:hypothetical protein